jgi:hypothetical protein
MLMLWNMNCMANIIQTILHHNKHKGFHHLKKKKKKNQTDGGLFSRSTKMRTLCTVVMHVTDSNWRYTVLTLMASLNNNQIKF